ncbi:MAG TPA: DUF269 domain-containing protein [Burkholderiales bacterium]|nr:DUF269 domain-containing protein [Burkholderiales bacterium]
MVETVEVTPMESLFVRELVKQWRAQDSYGIWEKKSDEVLLEPFYNAVGMAIERETGVMVIPMMKMHHEGFGRMALIAGRLIVINKQLRDVHRFGFLSLAKLAEEGEKLVNSGVEMIAN